MANRYDYLVIGSGLAGLAFALKASEHGKVCVLSKTRLETGNTEMAQGGIAAVMSVEDSLEQHVQDTLVAGAGLCNEKIVRMVVENGGAFVESSRVPRIAELEQQLARSQQSEATLRDENERLHGELKKK